MSFTKEDTRLPFDAYRKHILYLLTIHRVVIVVGETGSGKSTRIPRILFDAGSYADSSSICITQPRRVAAMQLARRVADELRCNLGSTVGYAIRFKDMTSPTETKIKFVTEGLLIRELLVDPLLKKYSVIMVDEVHERNSNTDILLGLLKCILHKRNDLKLILCSATVDIKSMMDFFNLDECPGVLQVEGRVQPITIYHLEKPIHNYMDSSVQTAIQIHEDCRLGSGSILIFLTGLDEISYVSEKLIEYARATTSRLDLRKMSVLAFHASLGPEDVAKVFERSGRNTRHCIVATNVAETSLTIPDVAFVIDCGFTKLRAFNPTTGIDSLVRVPISKSCAKQRAGRAGRTREGSVYRLYPESEYEKLDDDTVPELMRCSLGEIVILLKSLGVDNVARFPLPTAMPKSNLIAALDLLFALQAVDEMGQLTPTGEAMARLSVEPSLAKILVGSRECNFELCRIVAMLQVQNIYTKSRRYANNLWSNNDLIKICSAEGDLLTYLNILNSFQLNQNDQRWAEKRNLDYQSLSNALEIAGRLEKQLKGMGVKVSTCNGRIESVQRALASGLFPNAAYLHPCGDYKTIRGDMTVYIHPNSVYSDVVEKPKHVIYVDVLNTTRSYMQHVMSIETATLLDSAPHFYTFATSLEMARNKA